MLHGMNLVVGPTQSMGSKPDGGGFVQVLTCNWLPPPQVTLQAPELANAEKPPRTAGMIRLITTGISKRQSKLTTKEPAKRVLDFRQGGEYCRPDEGGKVKIEELGYLEIKMSFWADMGHTYPCIEGVCEKRRLRGRHTCPRALA